jgi:hypothetical protein
MNGKDFSLISKLGNGSNKSAKAQFNTLLFTHLIFISIPVSLHKATAESNALILFANPLTGIK